jgi:hypothetical protein
MACDVDAFIVGGLDLIFLFLALQSFAGFNYSFELGSTTQTLNDVKIPGNTGTKIDLTDFGKGPVTSYRIYLGYRWDRHEIRGLYAPLEFNLNGTLNGPTTFKNSVFQPGVSTDAVYKFNSYRLGYSYALEKTSEWDLRFGFTGKIRDAEVTLSQGLTNESKKNVGFVPLLNFQAFRKLSDLYSFQLDLDALGAPQGRAIDLGLFVERELLSPQTKAFIGYRTVEGGADNKTVYSFAWIHTLTLGFKGYL